MPIDQILGDMDFSEAESSEILRLEKFADVHYKLINKFWNGLDDDMPLDLASELTRVFYIRVVLGIQS